MCILSNRTGLTLPHAESVGPVCQAEKEKFCGVACGLCPLSAPAGAETVDKLAHVCGKENEKLAQASSFFRILQINITDQTAFKKEEQWKSN